jgi:hypothetical protein
MFSFNTKKGKNREISGVSRRNFLTKLGGAGLGLAAGGVLSALPVRKPEAPGQRVGVGDSSGTSIINIDLSQTIVPDGNPWYGVYGEGVIFIEADDYYTGGTMCVAIDIKSGSINAIDVPYYSEGHVVNSMLVAASTNGFMLFPYSAKWPQVTGAVLTSSPTRLLSNILPVGDDIMFVGVDSNLYWLNFYFDANGNAQYTNRMNPVPVNVGSAATIAAGGPNRIVASSGLDYYFIDITQNPPTFVKAATLLADTAVSVLATGSHCIFQGSNVLMARPWAPDAATIAKQSWTHNISGTICTPVAYNGVVLYGDSAGDLVALNESDGTVAWSVNLGNDLSQNNLLVEDGVAYLNDTAGNMYAVDLDNQGVVKNGDYQYMGPLMGVENGVVMFFYPIAVGALDLGSQIHGFSSESSLLPDGMNGSPGSNQPTNPVYQNHVQLLDPNKAPRSFISVNVSVFEPMTLVANGFTYQLTATKAAWLTTDGAGCLDFSIQAVDSSCPSVYLWSSFMDADEAIVLFPDHYSTAKLQSTTAATLSAAQTYNGSAMLPANTDPNQVANLMNAAMGAPPSTSMALQRKQQSRRGAEYAKSKKVAEHLRPKKHRRSRDRVLAAAANPTNYMTFPDTSVNMAYQYPSGGEQTRQFVGSETVSLSLSISEDGTVTPNATSAELAPHRHRLGSAISRDFSHFKSDVVHGVHKVATIATQVVKDTDNIAHQIVTDVINGVSYAYDVTINSLEDAITVVAGFLKSIVQDIEKVIEWLSEIFDWKNILKTKDDIKGILCNALASFSTWITNQNANGCADVHSFFQKIKTDFNEAVLGSGGIGRSVSGSPVSSQYNNNDPQTVYGTNGAHSQAAQSSFSSKVTNNIGGATMSSSLAPAFQPGSGVRVSAGCVGNSDLETLKTTIENTLKQCGQKLEGDAEKIWAALKQLFASFQDLATSASAFLAQAFHAVLELIVAVVDTLLDAADLVIELLMSILTVVIDGLVYLISAPIHIPIVSELWEVISDAPLSLLDVVALIIAIPATIILEVSGGLPNATRVGAPSTQELFWALSAISVVVVDALTDAIKTMAPEDPTSMLDCAFGALTFGLSYPTGEGLTALGGCHWGVQVTPVIICIINSILAKTKSEESAEYNALVPYLLQFFANVNAPGAIMMAFEEPNVYLGKDGVSLIGNLLSNLQLFAKPGVNYGPAGRLVCVGLDAACPLTGAVLTLGTS